MSFIDPYDLAPDYQGERDPSGLDAHQPGAKLDAGKVRPGLVLGSFPRALHGVSEVGTMGASKYSDNGWRHVEGGEHRYLDAMYRHLLAHHAGEDLDSGSGLDHLWHAAWNLLAVVELRALRG